MNENLKSNEWPRLLVAGRAHGESSSSKVFASLRSSISSSLGEPAADQSEKFAGLALIAPNVGTLPVQAADTALVLQPDGSTPQKA